jgi:hypothetical protein
MDTTLVVRIEITGIKKSFVGRGFVVGHTFPIEATLFT